MEEIWKDITGYEGLYEISNEGRVRTHKDKTTYTERHGLRRWQQIILKNKTPNGRDVRVSLWKNGKPKDFLVHRLVAYEFIPEVPRKESINHIDGNPRNNHVDNLEWCDHKENNNHAFDMGLMKTNKVIFLVNLKTGKSNYFRSMAKASKFLNRNSGYLSYILKKGKTTVGNYQIYIALLPDEYQKEIG